jgi:hypothetical protein
MSDFIDELLRGRRKGHRIRPGFMEEASAAIMRAAGTPEARRTLQRYLRRARGGLERAQLMRMEEMLVMAEGAGED